MTCIYSYLNAPENVCSLAICNNSIITTAKSMFPRSLAVACLISRITAIYKSIRDFPNHKKKIKEYDIYFPINGSKKYNNFFFTATIVVAYVVIVLPINIFRILLIYYHLQKIDILLFYITMYVQNLSICSTEIHFIVRCFGLNQKFQSINEDMAAVKSEIIFTNKYPVVLQTKRRTQITVDSVSNRDFFHSRTNSSTLSNSIELIRRRHQFVRGIVYELNDLYGIQIGMSMCVLFIMTLFDIHGEVITKTTKARSKMLIYAWLLQYTFRFCTIILTTHFTTKEVDNVILYNYIYISLIFVFFGNIRMFRYFKKSNNYILLNCYRYYYN